MGDYISLCMPLSKEKAESLRAGDRVLLSGYIYTARDAAHMRMIDALNNGEELPFNLEGQAIYYVGPTPERPGNVVGAAGPTTSGRMDEMTTALLDRGLRVMIGKGSRKEKVIESMIENGAVYLAAPGGAGALLSSAIKSLEVIAYEDLGPESVKKLYIEDMPLLVVIDSKGTDLYKSEPLKYKKES